MLAIANDHVFIVMPGERTTPNIFNSPNDAETRGPSLIFVTELSNVFLDHIIQGNPNAPHFIFALPRPPRANPFNLDQNFINNNTTGYYGND